MIATFMGILHDTCICSACAFTKLSQFAAAGGELSSSYNCMNTNQGWQKHHGIWAIHQVHEGSEAHTLLCLQTIEVVEVKEGDLLYVCLIS